MARMMKAGVPEEMTARLNMALTVLMKRVLNWRGRDWSMR
jgi:hypothetical protein